MSSKPIVFTVFTKPWTMPLPELGAFVQGLGGDGVELPVRPGYQVEPEQVATGLPAAAKILAAYGLAIRSVAGPTDEPTIAACAEAGVPLIRICLAIPPDRPYLAYEVAVRRAFDRLVPLLERYGVAIGVQNHSGRFVGTAMGLRRLIEGYDPRQIGAVWDPAHGALAGELPALALDIVWSHLRLVNLKNAYWRRTNGVEAEVAQYVPWWTSGRQGLCSWPQVAEELQQRQYTGTICLTAEYSEHAAVDRLIAQDLQFAKALLA